MLEVKGNIMEKRWNPLYQLRRLYHWTMRWAEHPKAEPALGLFSMVEGIFFPIPVDPFLLAMSAGKPKRSLRFAAIASLGSVVGGTIGYYLGYLFWDQISDFVFTYFFAQEKFNAVAVKFQNDAFLAVFLASFTPIPYKVFAVAGGVFQINVGIFILASIITRKNIIIKTNKKIFDTIIKARPASVKGEYFTKMTVSSSMGPGITIDHSALR